MNATYSPEDNKLRLYAESRLDPETYQRVKAAGFRWAPRQELFVAPMWTPQREDLLMELCSDIGDEDTSLAERTEERAERFTEYSGKRATDADQAHAAVDHITNGIPMGQPILVGHHSERHARRDAEKIENGMRRAVKMWETSKYWTSRAAGAIAAQKYKEAAPVRQRRIKRIETDKRRSERSRVTAERFLGYWTKDGLTHERARAITNSGDHYISRCYSLKDYPREPPASQYEGEMCLWSALEGIITAEQARDFAVPVWQRTIESANRWIAHYDNRLLYERAMLAEQGGSAADRFDFKIGGQVLVGRDWYVILRVNKSGGSVNSLTHTPPRHVTWTSKWKTGVESVLDYRPPAEGDTLKIAAATKKPPLCNYPGEEFAHITKAQWTRIHTNYKTTREVKTATTGKHRARWALIRNGEGRYSHVYLTDQKRVDPPAAALQPLLEELSAQSLPTLVAPPGMIASVFGSANDGGKPNKFELMKDSLEAGVQTVSAPQLFPTPVELARRMVQWAEIKPHHSILEPSAGTGRLIDAVNLAAPIETPWDGSKTTAVELSHTLASGLNAKYKHVTVKQGDFLGLTLEDLGKFDRILMNPPFANGTDIDHVMKAYACLRHGGILVAVMCTGPFFRSDRKSADFRDWLAVVGGEVVDLPPDTFKSSGTSVHCKLVKIT